MLRNYKNHVSIKEIQFGKKETVLDLKKKVIRCLNYVMGEDHQLELDQCLMKVFIPQFENKRSEIMSLISTVGKNEFFNFSGEEIKKDKDLIFVTINYLR